MTYLEGGQVVLRLNLMPPSTTAVGKSVKQYNDGEQYKVVVERLGDTVATVVIMDSKERTVETFTVDFGGTVLLD